MNKKIKISILLPTRGRFATFKKSVESLLDTCNDVNNFEILLAMDNDDKDTVCETKEYIKSKENIRLFSYERQHYLNLNNYYDKLSEKSIGDSLFLWNDDAIMESIGWDDIIIKEHDKFCVISPKVTNMEHYWNTQGVLFPIIPRKWFDLTGSWSYIQAADSWIDILSKRLGILNNVGEISISHDRHDLTGNNHDNTYIEGRSGVGISKEGWEIKIEEHYEKLNTYVETLDQDFTSKWGRDINYAK
jgi:hypothetical protein